MYLYYHFFLCICFFAGWPTRGGLCGCLPSHMWVLGPPRSYWLNKRAFLLAAAGLRGRRVLYKASCASSPSFSLTASTSQHLKLSSLHSWSGLPLLAYLAYYFNPLLLFTCRRRRPVNPLPPGPSSFGRKCGRRVECGWEIPTVRRLLYRLHWWQVRLLLYRCDFPKG